MNRKRHNRRGTVYVVVLAVLSIVITVSLSSLLNAQSELASASRSADEMLARSIARSGIELALAQIAADPNWRSGVSGAALIPKASLMGGLIRVEVTDPVDDDLLDDYSDSFSLTAIGDYGSARQMYRYRFEYAESHTMSPEAMLQHHPIGYWPLWGLDGDQSFDLRDLRVAQLRGKIQYGSQDPTGVYDMPTLHSTLQTYFEVDHEQVMELDYGSISVWFQPDALHALSAEYQVICAKHRYDEPDAAHFALVCVNGNLILAVDHAWSFRIDAIGSLTGDSWHHVVVTWGDSGWTAYFDGQPAGGIDSPLGLGTAWTDKPNTTKLRFGAAEGLFGRFGNTSMGHYFHGKICEAAMFAYELTPKQVEAIASQPPTPRPIRVDHASIERVID